MATVRVDDRAFRASIERLIPQLEVKAANGMRTIRDEMADRARSLVPQETGELANSITTTEHKEARSQTFDVIVSAGHAAFIEFGTEHSPAQPYLRPAIAEAAADLRRIGKSTQRV